MRYSQHSQTKYQIFKNNRICKIYCLPEKSGNVFYGKTRVFSNGRMFPSLKMRLLYHSYYPKVKNHSFIKCFSTTRLFEQYLRLCTIWKNPFLIRKYIHIWVEAKICTNYPQFLPCFSGLIFWKFLPPPNLYVFSYKKWTLEGRRTDLFSNRCCLHNYIFASTAVWHPLILIVVVLRLPCFRHIFASVVKKCKKIVDKQSIETVHYL